CPVFFLAIWIKPQFGELGRLPNRVFQECSAARILKLHTPRKRDGAAAPTGDARRVVWPASAVQRDLVVDRLKVLVEDRKQLLGRVARIRSKQLVVALILKTQLKSIVSELKPVEDRNVSAVDG